jgi:hypothetical protein
MEIISRLKQKVPEDMFIADDRYMAEMLSRLPGLARQASDRPDEYWQKQHRTIWNQISTAQLAANNASPRLLWAGIAAVIALAISLLFAGSRPEPSQQVDSRNNSDHELLLAVERAVQLDGPEALEPAALLAREIGRNQQNHSTDKGNQNHED